MSPIGNIMRACNLMLLTGLALWSAAGAYAQDRGEREKLADQLLSIPYGEEERADVEREFLDFISRAAFKRLRNDPGWNADAAVWQRNYPEFHSSYQPLPYSLGDAQARREIRAALVERLTEEELRQIVAALSGPEVAEMQALVKRVGLDLTSSMRMINVLTQPALYSQAERDAMRARVMALKEKEGELKASMPLMESALRTLRTPAFAKYQQALAQTLRSALARFETDPAAKKAMQDFLSEWRARVAR